MNPTLNLLFMPGVGPEDKAADLGHSRTGEVQGGNQELLPGRRGGPHGLRYHPQIHLQPS